MSELRLREVPASDSELMERIGRLRIAAYEPMVGTFPDWTAWIDRFDAAARHWAFFYDGEPVAAARLSIHSTIFEVPDAESYTQVLPQSPEGPIGSFNRLAVAPTFWGMGLSQLLDDVRLHVAEETGCKFVVGTVYSNERRIAQMVRAGWVVVGEGSHAGDPIAARFVKPPVVLMCYLPRPFLSAKTDEAT